MPEAPETTRAGWYEDPEQSRTWRYWDGLAWTDDRAPMGSPPPQGGELGKPRAGSSAYPVALAFLLVLVAGSLYNGQFAFALLWVVVGAVVGYLYLR